ncbi:signal peptidase I [Horticoccus sp. 23ND18S-11]|uniref:signal peptidase I n=1 Tax=Horticoccus sp. 23ND18S-11 TaxID=3391832 RepID=UPI0039C8D0B2
MTIKSLLLHVWREWVRPLAVPLLIIGAAKSALADINYVPSGSMKPTILEGDVLFVNKLAYDLRVPFTFTRVAQWSHPASGDIVVCFSPADGMRLVKRVVGVPGDTIELRAGALYRNGQRQNYAPLSAHVSRDLSANERQQARFARESDGTRGHAVMALPGDHAQRNFGPVTVPEASYFVMGDNRDNSLDSRFFGFVPRATIIGEATAVVVSGNLDHALRPRFGRFFTALE